MEELIEKLTEEHKLLAKTMLIHVLKGELRVPYREFEKEIKDEYGVEINSHFSVPRKIGLISEICFELGLPMLSIVAVNDKTQLPGDGFYKLYDKLHNTNYASNPVFEEKIRKEVKAEIQNCKDWKKLADFLEIEVEDL